jgi:hypothetical protein
MIVLLMGLREVLRLLRDTLLTPSTTIRRQRLLRADR